RGLIRCNHALSQLNGSLRNADCCRKVGTGQSHRQCCRYASVIARGAGSKVVELRLSVVGSEVSDNTSRSIRYRDLSHGVIAEARDGPFLQLGRHLLSESTRTNEWYR